MIEELDLSRVIEIIDLPEVIAAFPGLSDNNRLRAVAAGKVMLNGPELGIFEARWLGDWTAKVLDIDYDSTFLWEVFDKMFLEHGARSIYLSSSSRDAGARFRAVFLGEAFVSRDVPRFDWRLERDQYLQAARPVRDDRAYPVPPPLPRPRKSKTVQASA
jgi:hypothetical protein